MMQRPAPARAGGARRSRAPGPSRPGCMLRCVDLCPAVHVEASLVRGSAWMRVNDAAAGSGPGWGGPALAGPGPRAPAVCCAVWTYGQQSTWRPRLCADRLGCGLSGRRGCGWGGPALAGPRAYAPRLYAALCGPMVQQSTWRPRLCADRLGVRVNDAAAGSRPGLGGPGARGPPGPRALAARCAVWTVRQQS